MPADEILLAPAKARGRKPAAKTQDNGAGVQVADQMTTVAKMVKLPEWRLDVADIQIVGITPLITHAWSEKAKNKMLGKQLKEASEGRQKKDPFGDFVGALYPVEGDQMKFGMPAPSFKACAVTAANSVELKMTQMKLAFHVQFYTVEIVGEPIKKPITEWDVKYKKELAPYHALGISMRMDVVRLDNGNADLCFRPWWPKWKATLEVQYNPRMLSLDQLVNLIRAGGEGAGIGEWRPSSPYCRSGEYGRFTVVLK